MLLGLLDTKILKLFSWWKKLKVIESNFLNLLSPFLHISTPRGRVRNGRLFIYSSSRHISIWYISIYIYISLDIFFTLTSKCPCEKYTNGRSWLIFGCAAKRYAYICIYMDTFWLFLSLTLNISKNTKP